MKSDPDGGQAEPGPAQSAVMGAANQHARTASTWSRGYRVVTGHNWSRMNAECTLR
jgi:hypothetical protein